MPFESFFLGILVALLYAEVTGIYPGGIIVPAFLALFLDQPQRVVATVVVACLSLLVYRLLARYFILFGRRRFVLLLLIGGVVAQAWFLALPSLFSGPAELRVIGWIVPGLLANNLERQKFLLTLASLTTAIILTYFLSQFVSLLG